MSRGEERGRNVMAGFLAFITSNLGYSAGSEKIHNYGFTVRLFVSNNRRNG